MVTPFDAAEAIDEDAFGAEVEYLIEMAGVHGLAVGGSTGEGHTLSTGELRQLARIALERAAGRVPIIAGIIVDSTRQAIEKARALADLDVAALQVTPVHYLFRPTDEMMMQHFAALAEQAAQPIIVYNVVPWSYCSPALLDRMMRGIDGLIGVKQSAGDLKLMADLLMNSADVGLIMSAVDALLYPSFCLGAHGAIAAILSAVPELCVKLWQRVEAGDQPRRLNCIIVCCPSGTLLWTTTCRPMSRLRWLCRDVRLAFPADRCRKVRRRKPRQSARPCWRRGSSWPNKGWREW